MYAPSVAPPLPTPGPSVGCPDGSVTPCSSTHNSPGSTPDSARSEHGRPWKVLLPPTYDDKWENASKEELLKW